MFRYLPKILTFFFVILSQMVWAQYQIKGTIKGSRSGTYTLAHYFGSSQYINKAEAQIDNSGTLVFEGTNALPEGLYMLLSPRKQRVADFVIDSDQTFSFVTDSVNIGANMRVEGSRENELFYEYQRKVANLNAEIGVYQAQLKLRKDATGQQMLQAKINGLRNQAMEQFRAFIKTNEGSLAAKFMKASGDVELPNAPKRPDGKTDSTWLFQYYQDHFFDNIDFTDDRIVRTPFLQRRLDRYFKELIYPEPDTLKMRNDWVIDKALKGGQKELIAYCIWYLTNQSEATSYVGNESVFVHLAEKYYLGGIMPITDSTTIQGIREKVNTLKPLLVGKIMPELAVTDTTGTKRSLSEIKANYTVVVFYEPTCSHCRQAMPYLKQFYDKNKDSLGVKFYAVAIAGAPENWKKFIQEFGTGEWTNGYDYTFRINYRKDFDVVNAPTIYVLDADKKIIARRLPAEQLEGFMDFYEQKKKFVKE
ncbi:MAG: redoxin domain-containing protein [Spirosomaceae bacterium]|jgi:thiol-disulfide isomerase/thioredoxin|nr:redoxin domain-containing protein [Spirosomataceae bacterium]